MATPIWTLFSETEASLPELDRAHVAKLRVQPEMVVPVDVVVQLQLQLVKRREALLVDELGLQDLVRRLVDRVVVFAASVRAEDVDVGQGERDRGEGGLHELRALMLARRMADDLAVVEVDEEAYVVPPPAYPHVGQVRDDVRVRGVPVELAGDDVWQVGFVGVADMRLELGLGIGADQAALLHDAADAPPGRAEPAPLEHGLDLAGAVGAAVRPVGQEDLRRERIRLLRLVPAPAHAAAGRPRYAEDLALR